MLWEDSLIAQFVGVAPNYSVLQGAANLLWGRRKGPVTIMAMGNKSYIFKFNDVATSNWVTGQYFYGNMKKVYQLRS